MSMNVPTMKFKMPEKHLELGVMVEQGFAFGIGDEDGEDAVVVVGLHDAAIRPEKCEFLVEFELMTDYGFEVAHFDTPLFEVPGGTRFVLQGTSLFEITTTPDQYRSCGTWGARVSPWVRRGR